MSEILSNAIILLIMNMAEFCLVLFFLRNYFECKSKFLILYGFVFVSILTCINLQHDFVKNIITGFLLVLSVIIIGYKGRLSKKFAFTIIFVTISSLSENLVTFATSIFSVLSITNVVDGFSTYIFAGFAGKAILLLIICYLIKLHPQYYELDRNTDNVMLSLFPASAITATYVILDFDAQLGISKVAHLATIGLLIAFLFLSVKIFFIYHSALHKKHLENELKLNGEIRITSEKLFQQQIESVKAISAVQHEYKHHINNIVGYASQRQFDGLDTYIAQALEDANKYDLMVLIDFNNFPLSSLYGRLIQQCKEYNIELVTDIQYKSFQFISEVDANTIFGNLFDNALEACRNATSKLRKIKLSILRINNFVVVTLTNTKTNNIRFLSNCAVPLSTRRNYQSEGYGIKNIITSLIKYSGHLSLQHTDDEFCAIIRMEIKSTDDSWRQG